MNRLGKTRQKSIFTMLMALGTLGFSGRASADTKPKFVYATNAGSSSSSVIQAFQVTATATCMNYPCASALSISGNFTVTSAGAFIDSGTMFVTDSADVASSPLGLSLGYSPAAFYPDSPQTVFGVNSASTSNVSLAFPFSSFPATYAGGMLCTVASSSGCPSISQVVIAAADMSPSLLAETGGIPVIAQITSGTVTLTNDAQGSNSVSAYAINSTTGSLSLVAGSPFAAGSSPSAVVADPSGKFVYVANQGSNNVSAYSVNASTGVLSNVAGSPFGAGTGPQALAVDPSGKFLYSANEGSSNVSAYMIDTETGVLTPVSGSPFAAGNTPISITIDPAAGFVYVTTNNEIGNPALPTWGMAIFSMNAATGALTLVSSSPTFLGNGPIAGAINPAGSFLFETTYFNPSWGVSPFEINGATGALTGVAGGSGNVLPGVPAVHPSGNFLYVTDVSFGYIVAFAIDGTTGAITIIPGSADDNYGSWSIPAGPYATGRDPNSIVIDPTGKFAYVANEGSNNISGYAINSSTGALTPVLGTPFPAGVSPSSVAIVSESITPFEAFKAEAFIDEDRKTTFVVDGFFSLGAGNDGIYPLSETVELQVGTYTVTIPAGSFRERGRHDFEFNGTISDVDLRIRILQINGSDYLFTAEGRGDILKGITNPVTLGLTIGDDEGSETVRAYIDR